MSNKANFLEFRMPSSDSVSILQGKGPTIIHYEIIKSTRKIDLHFQPKGFLVQNQSKDESYRQILIYFLRDKTAVKNVSSPSYEPKVVGLGRLYI